MKRKLNLRLIKNAADYKLQAYTTDEIAKQMQEVSWDKLQVPVIFANKVRAIHGTSLSQKMLNTRIQDE